jgi:hypothetical protein
MGGGSPSIDTSFLGAQPRLGNPLNFQRILDQGQLASDQMWRSQLGYMGDIQSQLVNGAYNQGAVAAVNRATLAEGDMSNAGLAMTNAELSMAAAEGRMQGAEGRMQGAEGRIVDAEGRMRNAEGWMQQAETGVQRAEEGANYLAGRALTDSEATSIESELYRQGAADLALGRSLSPEQQRQAEQSARAAMQARGLGTSQAGVAVELLNRDAYASQREAERRSFAISANNTMSDNVLKRRQGAADMYGVAGGLAAQRGQLSGQRGQLAYQGGQLAGQAGQLAYQGGQLAGAGGALAGDRGQLAGQRGQLAYQRGGLALQGASQLAALDPIAMSWGLAGGTSGGMVGGGLDYSGNIASFNTNRQDSLYNSWMNNTASLNAANMQASAAGNAGNSALLGAGIGALGTIGGTALGGPLGGALGNMFASQASSAALPSNNSMWGM